MDQHSIPILAGSVAVPDAHHAVVVGASMAGLLAARVLADHYAHVTVVERDHLPATVASRAGAPQARHTHILLLRGQRILERLFPGLQHDLTAAGAPRLNLTNDWGIFQSGGWAPRGPSEYEVFTCSRDLLEAAVRERLRRDQRIHFLERHDAVGLLADPDRNHVVGIRLRARSDGQRDESEKQVRAALVVDASGRESRAPQWLTDLGFMAPVETTINSFLAYASRWYRRPRATTIDWRAALVSGQVPVEPRSGGVFPVEGDRWIVTLGGIGGVVPPTDEQGFLAFARALPVPSVAEAIEQAEPLTPIYGYRRTDNRLRHYEGLTRQPDGFVLIGDAVCAFNPVYGQGMTVAAMGAELLDRVLREHKLRRPDGDQEGFAAEFQRQLARVNHTPWLMATGADLGWPTTVGGRPSRSDRVVQRYITQVLRLVPRDPHTYRVFLEVTHLLRPPSALFDPRILRRMVRMVANDHTISFRRNSRGV
jgi:2-polyprenyl-6-methoxyphenol hydroxylase-like FAD-dependent oxidoreductase